MTGRWLLQWLWFYVINRYIFGDCIWRRAFMQQFFLSSFALFLKDICVKCVHIFRPKFRVGRVTLGLHSSALLKFVVSVPIYLYRTTPEGHFNTPNTNHTHGCRTSLEVCHSGPLPDVVQIMPKQTVLCHNQRLNTNSNCFPLVCNMSHPKSGAKCNENVPWRFALHKTAWNTRKSEPPWHSSAQYGTVWFSSKSTWTRFNTFFGCWCRKGQIGQLGMCHLGKAWWATQILALGLIKLW